MSAPSSCSVIVVGGGVIGLSCAIVLAQAGYAVRIWAKQYPPHTTSNVAAAFWHPYQVYPEKLISKWARRSYQEFSMLAQIPQSGVLVRPAIELYRSKPSRQLWHNAVEQLEVLSTRDLPLRSFHHLYSSHLFALRYSSFVIETPIYLPWLQTCARDRGVTFEQRELHSLQPALAQGDVVVHCSGLGATQLANDHSLQAVRGQVLWVKNPGLNQIVFDTSDPSQPTYIVPRSRDCVLGTSSQPNQANCTPDAMLADQILQRCQRLEPRLTSSTILGSAVGLRPCRPTVRLEMVQQSSKKYIIHNYGHGGGGVTLSWGCAYAVLQMLQQPLSPPP